MVKPTRLLAKGFSWLEMLLYSYSIPHYFIYRMQSSDSLRKQPLYFKDKDITAYILSFSNPALSGISWVCIVWYGNIVLGQTSLIVEEDEENENGGGFGEREPRGEVREMREMREKRVGVCVGLCGQVVYNQVLPLWLD